jgi:hypothetical protein
MYNLKLNAFKNELKYFKKIHLKKHVFLFQENKKNQDSINHLQVKYDH